MKYTIEELEIVLKMLNCAAGRDPAGPRAFAIDRSNGGYKLEDGEGREYTIRCDKKTLYHIICAMIDGIKIGRGE